MEESIERKRDLLVREVVSKGFNTEEFEDFVNNLKPEYGGSLDKWTLKDLEDCVKHFQIAKQGSEMAKKQDLLVKEIVDRSLNTEQFEQFVNKQRPDYGHDLEKLTFDELKGFVERFQQASKLKPEVPVAQMQQNVRPEIIEQYCITQERTQLDLPDTKIDIVSYQKVSGWFFQASYIAYSIRTSPHGWTVKRRYNDFVWLRDTLCTRYPTLAVPPIPGKRKWTFDDVYIKKRKVFLQRFLNNLMMSDLFRNDKFFLLFLLQNESDFNGTKQMPVKQVESYSNLRTMTGIVDCTISGETDRILQKSQEAVNCYDVYYKKLRRLCRELQQQQSTISNTLYGIGEVFGQFYSTCSSYNKEIGIKTDLMEDKYLTLNNMMITWGNMVNNEISEINDNLSNFLKFFHHQTRDLRTLIEKRNQIKLQFNQDSELLIAKKAQLFNLGDPTKWDIPKSQLPDLQLEQGYDRPETILRMLPKVSSQRNIKIQETQALTKLKYLYGAYTNDTFSEFRRVFSDQVRQFSEHFIRYFRGQTNRISQSHQQWALVIASLESMVPSESVLIQKRKHEDVIIESI